MIDPKGWYGVDLDGTLAKYDGWRGEEHIGEPIFAMTERVKDWLSQGRQVKIVTARVSMKDADVKDRVVKAIQEWCLDNLGAVLEVTNEKDFGMIELWDDRAVSVETNTGRRTSEFPPDSYQLKPFN